MPYFDEPVGRVKMQTTSENTQRYYTPKHIISDLLSKDFLSQNCDLPSSLTFHTARRNETSTNIVCYLYSFRALFVLYEAELGNKNPCHSLFLFRDHLRSNDEDHFRSGIICDSIWVSFAVRDHLRSWDHLRTRTTVPLHVFFSKNPDKHPRPFHTGIPHPRSVLDSTVWFPLQVQVVQVM